MNCLINFFLLILFSVNHHNKNSTIWFYLPPPHSCKTDNKIVKKMAVENCDLGIGIRMGGDRDGVGGGWGWGEG